MVYFIQIHNYRILFNLLCFGMIPSLVSSEASLAVKLMPFAFNNLYSIIVENSPKLQLANAENAELSTI